MALLTEAWTGSNGAAWPAHWTTAAPTGGVNDIQSNAGRQVSGTTLDTGPSARFNVTSSITDFDVIVTVTLLTAASTTPIITFRADSMVANRAIPTNGYFLVLNPGTTTSAIYGTVAGSPTLLGSASSLPITGASYKLHLRAVGSRMQANIWTATDREPLAWQIDVTETTYTSGSAALGIEDSVVANAGLAWDDLTLTWPPGQLAVPQNPDVAGASWINDLSVAFPNTYTGIDDLVPSDADYVESNIGDGPANYAEWLLNSVAAPAGPTAGHIVEYRYRKGSTGSGSTSLTVALRQGSRDIASWTHTGISTSYVQATQTLNAHQVALLRPDQNGNYSDLRLRVTPTSTTSTISKIADRGTTADVTGAGTSAVDLAAGASIAVNNYLIARVAVDNSGTNGVRPGLTVSDTRSNTWTVGTGGLIDPGAANAGSACYIAYAKVANAYSNGDDITFTWGTGSPPAKAIVIEEWAGIHLTTPVAVAEVQASGSTTAFTITSGTATAVGQLIYGVCSVEGPTGDTFPTDADVTALTRLSTSDGTAANNQTANGAYRITTAAAATTWNGTLGTTRDWASAVVVFDRDPGTKVQVSTLNFTSPPRDGRKVQPGAAYTRSRRVR